MREATGTVYGDIGTSVLYTIMEMTKETIRIKHNVHDEEHLRSMIENGGDLISAQDALGSFSLVLWALIFLTIKYDVIVMRADNRGEGGTFALWGLLQAHTGKIVGIAALGYLVVAAAGLLAADGVITPPISMLGAYEPSGEHWAVMATVVSLFILFKSQWRGTSKVGGFFGWFMMLFWFPWIALKGLPWAIRHPEVIRALNPTYAFHFLVQFPHLGAFAILGVAVLAITGGEAKYADIGHFSRKGETEIPQGQSVEPRNSGHRPVMYSWFALVLPCLLCNYAGQVGYVLERGVPARANTFYALTPQTGDPTVDHFILIFDLFVSAIAAFIASQALDHGHVFDRQASDRAGLLSAVRRQLHEPGSRGADLHLGRQLGDVSGLPHDHSGLSFGRQPRGRLRHCRHRHDGHHDIGLRLCGTLPLGLAALEGGRGLRTIDHS